MRIVPLGGLGEVGMNCLALEAEGRIAVVDCGVLFPDENLGVDVVAPDLTWLLERREQVGAVFLTHGHEDHIGALPFLLRHLHVPVFGTRFTLASVRRRLAEAGVAADLREVVPGDVRQAGEGGPLAAEFVAVTHSIPDACALAFRTPQGVVIHTGDFKLDERPVAGPATDLARFEALGREGVRLLLSDSTNAEQAGSTLSESVVGPALEDVMHDAPGRVFVATFASNVHRLHQVIRAAAATGRRLALLGRGMVETFEVARALGYLTEPHWLPVEAAQARRLPRRELAVLTTGTQGEPRSALSRLARGEHPDLSIERGDTVVLSSRRIPGSELALGRLLDDLCRRGADVRTAGAAPLHASGHAHEGEQRRLLALVRPRHFVPVHGQYRHLARHLAHAVAEGVPRERCHLLEDGQVLELDEAGARILPARVPFGRVYAVRDELGASDVPELVVRDRRLLAEHGLCLAVLVLDRTSGEVVRGPDLFGVGVAGLEGREAELQGEVLRAVGALPATARADLGEVQEALRGTVRRFFRRATGRRPAVLPVVLEL
ncbi:MAG: ribonuclease J [Anaeromyxobacter sp.]|nr:ribonuclease J [Anaeromyxobacter sp.]MBL0278220.1 ribonuclease J [Anaeromyxobacter sp.]